MPPIDPWPFPADAEARPMSGGPRILRTRADALWHTDDEGGVWRCLTPVGDRTVDKLTDRARGQVALAKSVRAQRAQAESIIAELVG